MNLIWILKRIWYCCYIYHLLASFSFSNSTMSFYEFSWCLWHSICTILPNDSPGCKQLLKLTILLRGQLTEDLRKVLPLSRHCIHCSAKDRKLILLDQWGLDLVDNHAQLEL